MSRPRRIPARGDVTAAAVAELLGLSLSDFMARGQAFCARDSSLNLIPPPAFTASKLWIGGGWQASTLFPELTTAPAAAHAGAVFDQRIRRFNG